MINVPPTHLETIKKILQKHVPDCEVRAFGSRVKGKVKSYSDLDLAIVGGKKLSTNIIYSLKEDLQESDIPFRVDVIDWNAISPEFKAVVEKGYEVLQKSEARYGRKLG